MKRRKKKSPSSGDYVPKTLQQRRHWRIWRDFGVGVVLTIALLLGETVIEKNSRIEAAHEFFYDLLQFRLTPIKAKEDSIAVLDIPLEPNPKDVAGEHYTARKSLEEIVEGLLKHCPKQCPTAIGLDVDFSMKDGAFFSYEDKKFLDSCLAHRSQIGGKLFVGVVTGLERGPERWLGERNYNDLATYIGHPNRGIS